MNPNITSNTLSFRKSNRIPIFIVHLETQFYRGILRYDIIVKIMSTRENTIFWFTSTAFIFDRGKVVTIKKLTVLWLITKILKFYIYSKSRHSESKMSNSKMPSMFTYTNATKHKPSSARKSYEKKLGNYQLNYLISV